MEPGSAAAWALSAPNISAAGTGTVFLTATDACGNSVGPFLPSAMATVQIVNGSAWAHSLAEADVLVRDGLAAVSLRAGSRAGRFDVLGGCVVGLKHLGGRRATALHASRTPRQRGAF